MSKARGQYVCQACGSLHHQWMGRCSECQTWNSLLESHDTREKKRSRPPLTTHALQGGESTPLKRVVTGLGEFDRVTGGGLVPGATLLIGGDPGIGKSTLLLQLAASLSSTSTLYVSGEESVDQIRLRAQRLGVPKTRAHLATGTNVHDIIATMASLSPGVVIVDSIQTTFTDTFDSSPGTVSQVRACTQLLIEQAKKHNATVILVGHVTKDGALAGPRVLEHMVDTVLHFEGDHDHHFRILRGVKNRFGPTHEIGVFDMTGKGLKEVPNPSKAFLSDRTDSVPGSCVFSGMEGTRPLLVEIQALVAPSSLNLPRRTAVGWDGGRLAMILAVLETRAGFTFSHKDVYLNIAGGLRIVEPAADLAVAVALVSSLAQVPVPADMVAFGEIGLSGDVRMVPQGLARIRESKKLGFCRMIVPSREQGVADGVTISRIRKLPEIRAALET